MLLELTPLRLQFRHSQAGSNLDPAFLRRKDLLNLGGVQFVFLRIESFCGKDQLEILRNDGHEYMRQAKNIAENCLGTMPPER